MKPTAKQRRAIEAAYHEIVYITSQTDWTLPAELRDALRDERRQCSNLLTAKALIVESFTHGANAPMALGDAVTYRPGCRFAHLLGAHFAKRYAELVFRADIQAVLQASNAAKQEIMEARFAEIRDGEQ